MGTISRGKFGAIVFATDFADNTYAIKTIRKSLIDAVPTGLEDIFKERKILIRESRFTCALKFAFQDIGYLFLGIYILKIINYLLILT